VVVRADDRRGPIGHRIRVHLAGVDQGLGSLRGIQAFSGLEDRPNLMRR
jgi:hypothetical protein